MGTANRGGCGDGVLRSPAIYHFEAFRVFKKNAVKLPMVIRAATNFLETLEWARFFMCIHFTPEQVRLWTYWKLWASIFGQTLIEHLFTCLNASMSHTGKTVIFESSFSTFVCAAVNKKSWKWASWAPSYSTEHQIVRNVQKIFGLRLYTTGDDGDWKGC